ncbi:MAG: cysteine--tRNA ligase [Nanoarchaeota archaeon]|nr:cysteine--tRNA ligase [Nanoarchaeota archaeon]MBU1031296.1 cysteine--tRNA ligase [Nanoarchaeota archaeon]MBU1849441.1 cysteine--tRNA ligase [Nanoarchaeota archaeon]
MKLKLSNTLSRNKEEFKPIRKEEIGMYCCGPTVYNYAHIGNLRAYIFEDILRRTLEFNRFKVKHIINITDVGHLTSDADSGEDKMVKAIRREGLDFTEESMLKLAKKYTLKFKENFKDLNILEPNIWCKATEHIPEMIKLVEKILENGFAYETSTAIYFDISKFKDYGKLAKLNIEQLEAGARIEPDPEKHNPLDFALWFKAAGKHQNHVMQWDSPWGKGFPGWHIECSAMSMKHLGEQFDIHCGGIDHIPVHHTNEIAQAEAAIGKKWVNYWLHNDFLVMKEGKMAKSKGEFLTLQVLKDKGYNPLSYRYFCLGAHYKTQLTFSFEALDGAESALKRLKENVVSFKENNDSVSNKKIEEEYKKRFLEAINNDLNTPLALAVVWEVVKDKEIGNNEKLKLLCDFDKVLGLGIKTFEKEKVVVSGIIDELLKKRDDARKNKDWSKADKIRDEIKEKGFAIKDTPEGPVLEKI